MFFKARKNVIKFFDNYSLILSEAKRRATKGAGLKILNPKKNTSKITNSSCTSKSRC